MYALSSAALTFTIARACSSGGLHSCTCAGKPSTPTDGRFQWGGCGDNVKWGVQFARRWSDNVEKGVLEKKEKVKRDDQGVGEIAAMNLHNNRVGRKVSRQKRNVSRTIITYVLLKKYIFYCFR